jgi:hypothetical protein
MLGKYSTYYGLKFLKLLAETIEILLKILTLTTNKSSEVNSTNITQILHRLVS